MLAISFGDKEVKCKSLDNHKYHAAESTLRRRARYFAEQEKIVSVMKTAVHIPWDGAQQHWFPLKLDISSYIVLCQPSIANVRPLSRVNHRQ
jgi:hypothetical protein